MPITQLTRDEMVSDLKAFLSALDATLSVSNDTDAGIRIQMLADALMGFQSQLRELELDLYPDTASLEALVHHAEVHLGPSPRKAATVTDEIEYALTVTGTVGATVDAGDTLIHVDGTRYRITTAATIPVGGSIPVDLQSLTTGTVANKSAGELLTFETPPTGIDAEATLALAMTGATDEETEAELLVRLLDVIRNPHAGGRASDYRQWAMAVAKVASAWVYAPCSAHPLGRRGYGCVDVAILTQGSGAARIPSAATQSAVTEAIDALRPAAMAGFSVLLPAAVTQGFDVRVTPEPDYAFDWATGGTTYTIGTWTAGTKTITWSPSRPAAVVAGVRLLIGGEQVEVVSVSGSDSVIDTALGGTPGGANIYPGGPLVEPVQEAIQDYMDSLGPAKGDAYDRYHDGWEDTVKLAKVYRTVLGVTGVADAQIVTPAANVAPTDHAAPGTVDLLVAGAITVRVL